MTSFWYRKSSLVIKALVTGVLTVSFVLEPAAFAAPVLQNPSAVSAVSSGKNLEIPQTLGRAEESSLGASGKTIYFIQDAHDSLEAQEHIAKLVEWFVRQQGVKTVYEEGYEGEVPTEEYFGFIKDSGIRQKVSYALLDQLRIGGAEYAHINRFSSVVSHEPRAMSEIEKKNTQDSRLTTPDFKLVGADSIELHLKNIAQYRKADRLHQKIQRDLDELSSLLEIRMNQTFPRAMKDWMKMKTRYERGELPLLDYLKRGVSLLETAEVSSFPHLQLLLAAEKTKNPSFVNRVKAADTKNLFSEITALEKRLARQFLPHDPKAGKLFDYHQTLHLFQRLKAMEVSSGEFEAAKAALNVFDTQSFAEFMANEFRKPVFLSRRWESAIRQAVKFYELAQKRDEAVSNALDQFMRNPDEEKAVLVYGGFHKDAVREILHQKEISYTMITPKMSGPDIKHQAIYKKLMRSQETGDKSSAWPATAARPQPIFSMRSGHEMIQQIYQTAALQAPPSTPVLEKAAPSRRSESRAYPLKKRWMELPESEVRRHSRILTREKIQSRHEEILKDPEHQALESLQLGGQDISVKLVLDQALIKRGLTAEKLKQWLEWGYEALGSDVDREKILKILIASEQKEIVFGMVRHESGKWGSRSLIDISPEDHFAGLNSYLFETKLPDSLVMTFLFRSLLEEENGKNGSSEQAEKFQTFFQHEKVGGKGDLGKKIFQWHRAVEKKRYFTSQKTADDFMEAFRDKYTFMGPETKDFPEVYKRLRDIADRLLIAEGYDPRNFQLHLSDNEQSNAFVTRFANHIVINTGLIHGVMWGFMREAYQPSWGEFLKNFSKLKFRHEKSFDEPENLKKFAEEHIAFILAHEIAHMTQQRDLVHEGGIQKPETIEEMHKRMGESNFETVVHQVEEQRDTYVNEIDADRRALEIMDRAGMSVKEAHISFQIMNQRKYSRMMRASEIAYSDHPLLLQRIQSIKTEIQQKYFPSYGSALTFFAPAEGDPLAVPFLKELVKMVKTKMPKKAAVFKRSRKASFESVRAALGFHRHRKGNPYKRFKRYLERVKTWEEYEVAAYQMADFLQDRFNARMRKVKGYKKILKDFSRFQKRMSALVKKNNQKEEAFLWAYDGESGEEALQEAYEDTPLVNFLDERSGSEPHASRAPRKPQMINGNRLSLWMLSRFFSREKIHFYVNPGYEKNGILFRFDELDELTGRLEVFLDKQVGVIEKRFRKEGILELLEKKTAELQPSIEETSLELPHFYPQLLLRRVYGKGSLLPQKFTEKTIKQRMRLLEQKLRTADKMEWMKLMDEIVPFTWQKDAVSRREAVINVFNLMLKVLRERSADFSANDVLEMMRKLTHRENIFHLKFGGRGGDHDSKIDYDLELELILEILKKIRAEGKNDPRELKILLNVWHQRPDLLSTPRIHRDDKYFDLGDFFSDFFLLDAGNYRRFTKDIQRLFAATEGMIYLRREGITPVRKEITARDAHDYYKTYDQLPEPEPPKPQVIEGSLMEQTLADQPKPEEEEGFEGKKTVIVMTNEAKFRISGVIIDLLKGEKIENHPLISKDPADAFMELYKLYAGFMVRNKGQATWTGSEVMLAERATMMALIERTYELKDPLQRLRFYEELLRRVRMTEDVPIFLSADNFATGTAYAHVQPLSYFLMEEIERLTRKYVSLYGFYAEELLQYKREAPEENVLDFILGDSDEELLLRYSIKEESVFSREIGSKFWFKWNPQITAGQLESEPKLFEIYQKLEGESQSIKAYQKQWVKEKAKSLQIEELTEERIDQLNNQSVELMYLFGVGGFMSAKDFYALLGKNLSVWTAEDYEALSLFLNRLTPEQEKRKFVSNQKHAARTWEQYLVPLSLFLIQRKYGFPDGYMEGAFTTEVHQHPFHAFFGEVPYNFQVAYKVRTSLGWLADQITRAVRKSRIKSSDRIHMLNLPKESLVKIWSFVEEHPEVSYEEWVHFAETLMPKSAMRNLFLYHVLWNKVVVPGLKLSPEQSLKNYYEWVPETLNRLEDLFHEDAQARAASLKALSLMGYDRKMAEMDHKGAHDLLMAFAQAAKNWKSYSSEKKGDSFYLFHAAIAVGAVRMIRSVPLWFDYLTYGLFSIVFLRVISELWKESANKRAKLVLLVFVGAFFGSAVFFPLAKTLNIITVVFTSLYITAVFSGRVGVYFKGLFWLFTVSVWESVCLVLQFVFGNRNPGVVLKFLTSKILIFFSRDKDKSRLDGFNTTISVTKRMSDMREVFQGYRKMISLEFYEDIRNAQWIRFFIKLYFRYKAKHEKGIRLPWQFNEPGNVHSQIDVMTAYPLRRALVAQSKNLNMTAGEARAFFEDLKKVIVRKSPVRDEMLMAFLENLRNPESPISNEEKIELYDEVLNPKTGKTKDSMLFHPFFREQAALKALELAIQIEEEKTAKKVSFKKEKELVLRYFPEFSFTRDDLLTELLERAENPPDYRELFGLLLQVQDNAVKEDAKNKIFLENKIRAFIQLATSRDKEEFALWLMDVQSEKPFIVQEVEYAYFMNMDYLKDLFYSGDAQQGRYKTIGTTFKRDFVEMIFGGDESLVEDEKVFFHFLDQIFEKFVPQDTKKRERIRRVFMTIFKHVSSERKVKIVANMAGTMRLGKESDLGNLVTAFFKSLGLLGPKMAQIISHSDADIDPKISDALETLSSEADLYAKKNIYQFMDLILGDRFEDHFEAILDQLGSASIKTVYEMLHKHFGSVVLKAKRPEVDKVLEEDLKDLEEIIQDLRGWTWRKFLPRRGLKIPKDTSATVRHSVEEEVDFILERYNRKMFSIYQKMRESAHQSGGASAFVGSRPVRFISPVGIDELDQLIPEKLQNQGMFEQKMVGIKLKALMKENNVLGLTSEEVRELKKVIFQDLMEQMFLYGLFHADPHGGNIWVRLAEDGKTLEVIYLDLGSMGRNYLLTLKQELDDLAQQNGAEALDWENVKVNGKSLIVEKDFQNPMVWVVNPSLEETDFDQDKQLPPGLAKALKERLALKKNFKQKRSRQLASWVLYMALHKGKKPDIPANKMLEARFFKESWYLMRDISPLEVAEMIFGYVGADFPETVAEQIRAVRFASEENWEDIDAGNFNPSLLDKTLSIGLSLKNKLKTLRRSEVRTLESSLWVNTSPEQTDLLPKEKFEAARQALEGNIVRTPLIKAGQLSAITGKEVFVKDESAQVGGAFKARGVYLEVLDAIMQAVEDKQHGREALREGLKIVTQSTGNHGIAMIRSVTKIVENLSVQYQVSDPELARDILRIEPIVFTLKNLPDVKLRDMRAALADYRIKFGKTQGAVLNTFDTYETALEARQNYLAEHSKNAKYMDHGGEKIMLGHGTAGIEIAEQLKEMGISENKKVVLIVPVGAGGPLGIAAALKHYRPNVTAVMVQSDRWDAFVRTLQTDQLQKNPKQIFPTETLIRDRTVTDIIFPDGIAVDAPEADSIPAAKIYLDAAVSVDELKAYDESGPLLYQDLRMGSKNPGQVRMGGTTALTAEALLSHGHQISVIREADAVVLFGTEGNVAEPVMRHLQSRLSYADQITAQYKNIKRSEVREHKEQSQVINVNLDLLKMKLYSELSEKEKREARAFINKAITRGLKVYNHEDKMNAWLAYDRGKPVGIYQYMSDEYLRSQRKAMGAKVYVLPEYRRHGIAKKMRTHLLRALKQQGVLTFEYHVSKDRIAQKFQQSLGEEPGAVIEYGRFKHKPNKKFIEKVTIDLTQYRSETRESTEHIFSHPWLDQTDVLVGVYPDRSGKYWTRIYLQDKKTKEFKWDPFLWVSAKLPDGISLRETSRQIAMRVQGGMSSIPPYEPERLKEHLKKELKEMTFNFDFRFTSSEAQRIKNEFLARMSAEYDFYNEGTNIIQEEASDLQALEGLPAHGFRNQGLLKMFSVMLEGRLRPLTPADLRAMRISRTWDSPLASRALYEPLSSVPNVSDFYGPDFAVLSRRVYEHYSAEIPDELVIAYLVSSDAKKQRLLAALGRAVEEKLLTPDQSKRLRSKVFSYRELKKKLQQESKKRRSEIRTPKKGFSINDLTGKEMTLLLETGYAERQLRWKSKFEFWRKSKAPKKAISAGVFVLRKIDGEWSVLWGRKTAKKKGDVKWVLPAGRVSKKTKLLFEQQADAKKLAKLNLAVPGARLRGRESMPAAALRELLEETGIAGTLDGRLDDRWNGRKHKLTGFFIHVSPSRAKRVKAGTDELESFQWMPVSVLLAAKPGEEGLAAENYLKGRITGLYKARALRHLRETLQTLTEIYEDPQRMIARSEARLTLREILKHEPKDPAQVTDEDLAREIVYVSNIVKTSQFEDFYPRETFTPEFRNSIASLMLHTAPWVAVFFVGGWRWLNPALAGILMTVYIAAVPLIAMWLILSPTRNRVKGGMDNLLTLVDYQTELQKEWKIRFPGSGDSSKRSEARALNENQIIETLKRDGKAYLHDASGKPFRLELIFKETSPMPPSRIPWTEFSGGPKFRVSIFDEKTEVGHFDVQLSKDRKKSLSDYGFIPEGREGDAEKDFHVSFIAGLYVKETYQKRHIGSVLIGTGLRLARAFGAETFYGEEVRHDAQGFFDRIAPRKETYEVPDDEPGGFKRAVLKTRYVWDLTKDPLPALEIEARSETRTVQEYREGIIRRVTAPLPSGTSWRLMLKEEVEKNTLAFEQALRNTPGMMEPDGTMHFDIRHLLLANQQWHLAQAAEFRLSDKTYVEVLFLPKTADRTEGLQIFKFSGQGYDPASYFAYSVYSVRKWKAPRTGGYLSAGIHVLKPHRGSGKTWTSREIFEKDLQLLYQRFHREFSIHDFVLDVKTRITGTKVGDPLHNAVFYLKRGFYPPDAKDLTDEILGYSLGNKAVLPKESIQKIFKISGWSYWVLEVPQERSELRAPLQPMPAAAVNRLVLADFQEVRNFSDDQVKELMDTARRRQARVFIYHVDSTDSLGRFLMGKHSAFLKTDSSGVSEMMSRYAPQFQGDMIHLTRLGMLKADVLKRQLGESFSANPFYAFRYQDGQAGTLAVGLRDLSGGILRRDLNSGQLTKPVYLGVDDQEQLFISDADAAGTAVFQDLYARAYAFARAA